MMINAGTTTGLAVASSGRWHRRTIRVPKRTPRAVASPHRPLDTPQHKQLAANQLDMLRNVTMVVADTGELDEIKRYTPQDCTTNPTLVLRALSSPSLQHLVAGHGRTPNELRPHADAADRLVMALGTEILKHIPGRVSSEVDAHLSHDAVATYDKALRLLDLYSAHGIDQSRVYIKIASTWEGIQACAALQKQSIACNMTLLFNLAQAVAAADAGAALISPFVGRIRDWHMKKEGREYAAHEDPGVVSVQRIYQALKQKLGSSTIVMGASFRTVDEIRELAGIDALTIAPSLLEALRADTTPLPRKLQGGAVNGLDVMPVLPAVGNHAAFEAAMAGDAMASELLEAGIAAFSADQRALEAAIAAQSI